MAARRPIDVLRDESSTDEEFGEAFRAIWCPVTPEYPAELDRRILAMIDRITRERIPVRRKHRGRRRRR